MGDALFGVSDRPAEDFWRFLRGAVWASILVTFIYFAASIISDLVQLYLNKRDGNVQIPWRKFVLNGFAKSVYSFTSSILLYLLL